MLVTLDRVENLQLSDKDAAQHANELNSLAYLGQGLGFLYGQVKKIEDGINAQLNPNLHVSMFGNAPGLRDTPQGLVACAFHWYAVSICNYVRLVGWLTHDADKKQAEEYVERVLPAVFIWRNKVAAHFAITAPRSEDTPADLAASIMFPISFDDDAFYAATMKLAMRRAGTASASREDMRWSLTHTHKNLSTRYWPEIH